MYRDSSNAAFFDAGSKENDAINKTKQKLMDTEGVTPEEIINIHNEFAPESRKIKTGARFIIVDKSSDEAWGKLDDIVWEIIEQDDETFEVKLEFADERAEFHDGHESMAAAIDYIREGGF